MNLGNLEPHAPERQPFDSRQPHARAVQPLDSGQRLAITFLQGELVLQLEQQSGRTGDYSPVGTPISIGYRHVAAFQHKLLAVVQRAGALALFAPLDRP